jgi:hypothetical protein
MAKKRAKIREDCGGRRPMNKSLFFFAAGVLAAAFFWTKTVFADERLLFASGQARSSFLELYTSDANANGNSAIEWMSTLKGKEFEGILWKKVVPIAFHVHSWDEPGQKDPFGRPENDQRLLAYKKKWGMNNVYCPTVAVNGVEWSGWSRQQPIPTETRVTGELVADGTKREGVFQVDFKPAKSLGAEKFTVHAAMVAFGLQSKPSEGRNRGKSLLHDFISLGHQTRDFHLNREGFLTSSVELARPKGLRIQKFAVIFWVTIKGDVLPIQATGGYLPN